jgi:hypothetical protein
MISISIACYWFPWFRNDNAGLPLLVNIASSFIIGLRRQASQQRLDHQKGKFLAPSKLYDVAINAGDLPARPILSNGYESLQILRLNVVTRYSPTLLATGRTIQLAFTGSVI